MIVITNISEDALLRGMNKYELKINEKVICRFEHDRHPEGLAQCLRDAADAVDKKNDENQVDITELRDLFRAK